MNLKEFINKVIIEEGLKSDDIEAIVKDINKHAREKAVDNVACISDEDVRGMIIDFINKSSNEVKEAPETKKEVNDGESKQISLFESIQTY
ncbi:MAG: hypothetical protein J6N95_05585 [Bacilli bacterium]|nr:hypothetical protein [Bacilli bacterium]